MITSIGVWIDKLLLSSLKRNDELSCCNFHLRQNIRAQNNILAALTEKNAEYAAAREKIGAFVRDRNEMIGGLVASFHVYEDLLDKTTKGLEFYARSALLTIRISVL